MSSPNESLSEKKVFDEDDKTPVIDTILPADDAQRAQVAMLMGTKAEEDNIAPRADVMYVLDKVVEMKTEEAIEILNAAIDYHTGDRNFPYETMAKIRQLVQGPEVAGMDPENWEFDLKTEAALIMYHSPYPEVRAIADPFDDPTIPVETIRSYFLAMLWSIIGMGVNTFFSPRFPTIQLSAGVIQVLLYPCGKFLEMVLPDWGFTVGGIRHSLNPGPWTYKEQMFCTIVFTVNLSTIYVYWNFTVQKLPMFFDGNWVTFGYEVLLTLSNQCMGFGFAGLLRRFSIYPSKAIWPTVLPTISLSRALLVPENKNEGAVHGWTITRYKYFMIVFCAGFMWYWIPGYLFNAVSNFNWTTWIAPNNLNLAIITGTNSGLGLNPISTFDWVIINSVLPFQSPFFAFFQQFCGNFMGFFVIVAIYYTRTKWTSFIPVNTSSIYANDGTPYEVTQILTNNLFDEAKYQNYSPPFYSAGNLVVYGAFFAYYPLSFVYMLADSWRDMLYATKGVYKDLVFDLGNILTRNYRFFSRLLKGDFKGAREAWNEPGPQRPSMYQGYKDAHSAMMMKYSEAPDWWFFLVLVVSFVFALVVILVYPIETPVWTIFFVIALNFCWLVPMTIVNAQTGIYEGLNVLTELIIGYALPGDAQALMTIKAFGYNIDGQSDTYISALKMAHYAKLPPRAVFRGQVFSTIMASFVSLGVMNWAISNVQGLCELTQPEHFNCENGSWVYYSSAVMWGSIGPKRVFNTLYPELKWCFLVGFLVALLFIAGQKGGKGIHAWSQANLGGMHNVLDKSVYQALRYLDYVNPSVVCNGFLYWAPLNLYYQMAGMFANFAFHYVIKRRYTAWWEKYTFVTVAAMTAATAFCAIIMFFAVEYVPRPLSWWGNNVPYNGVDAVGLALDTLAPNQTFGPSNWWL